MASKISPFRPQDALRQAMIQGLAMSPDGETLVYARRTIVNNAYRTHLWRVPFRGGRAEQLTSAAANDGRARFSPDGADVLFISDRSGKPQAWTLPMAGGEPRMLHEMSDGAGAADWSPDGKHVLLLAPSGEQRFIVGKPDDPVARRIRDYVWRVDGVGVLDQHTSAWVIDANGRAKPRRVTRPELDVAQAFWSPDGARIGFLADAHPPLARGPLPQAWWVPATGGRKERPLGALPGGITAASWGRRGVVAAGIRRPEPDGWERVALHLLDRGEVTPLDQEDETVTWIMLTYGDLMDTTLFGQSDLAWLDDRTIVARGEVRGRTPVFIVDPDGRATQLVEGDVVCTALAVAAGKIAVVANVDANAGEVYAVEDGGLRRLTTNGSRWFAPYRREPEHLSVRHRDGHQLEGWLLRAGRKRHAPLVVNVHGGPHCSHNPTPWMEMLALADAGIHVLWANPRGSSGYGEGFASAINGEWGRADAADLLLLIDRLVREGLVDRDRVGVVGLSYGGFMVNWLLGHHPGRFAAGVSENPVSDLVAEFGSADFGSDIGLAAAGSVLPSDAPDAWREGSPSSKIHLNEAPLLLLQAENDLRCPPVNSEIVFAIMKTLGRQVEMVRYPGESHAMFESGRPDRRVDRLERIVDWFTTYL